MALPTSRDYDAVDSGPLNATVINNLQDAVVERKHGEILKLVGLESWRRDPGVTVTSTRRFYEMTASGLPGINMLLPLHKGDRVKAISVHIVDIAPGTLGDGITLTVARIDASTGWNFLALGSKASAQDGTKQKLTYSEALSDPGMPFTVTDDRFLEIVLQQTNLQDNSGSQMWIYPGIEILYDHP